MWKAIGQKPDINFGIRQASYEIRVEIPKDGSARDLLITRNFDRFLIATQERRAAWCFHPKSNWTLNQNS
ncbi:MAG: hypothetical protein CMQ45_10450 [Gammaproteobacteria bacterium]|nr:hypothetical protein [Gammaproteobacteria bacterium]